MEQKAEEAEVSDMKTSKGDDFQNWRDALAGKEVLLHADTPHPGFYRMRNGKNGPWIPVAIWNKDGALVARVASEMKDPATIWTWCAGNPVSKDAAKVAFETGNWPGDIMIGHNSGGLSLAEEIEQASDMALSWLNSTGINDKTTADMCANFRARILELKKTAEAEHKAKKAPHLEAGRKIDAEYKPIIDAADEAASTLRTALSRYLAAEEEKARKAAEAAARAENERRMAEFAKQQAARAATTAPDETPLPLDAPVMAQPEPVRVQAGGQRGRKAGLRDVTRYAISDYAAALAHVQAHPDVRAAVEKVAFAQARTGVAVPGVSSFIEKVAV